MLPATRTHEWHRYHDGVLSSPLAVILCQLGRHQDITRLQKFKLFARHAHRRRSIRKQRPGLNHRGERGKASPSRRQWNLLQKFFTSLTNGSVLFWLACARHRKIPLTYVSAVDTFKPCNSMSVANKNRRRPNGPKPTFV